MYKCPNINDQSWKDLVDKIGLEDAYREFLIHGDVPDSKNYDKNNYKQERLKNIKYELRNDIRGIGPKTEGDLIQTATSYFAEGTGIGQGTQAGSSGDQQKGSFVNFIEQNKLWYTEENPEDFTEVGKGQEQIVFITPDGKNVIKVNGGSYYKNWKEYLNSLSIHNKLFPTTSYKLLGFRKLETSQDVEAIVQQPYVEKTSSTDLLVVRDLLASNGFEPWGDDKKRDFNYYNKDLGIHLDDLHAENVIVSHEIPFFIDTRTWVDSNFWSDNNEYQQKQIDDKGRDIQTSNRGANKIISTTDSQTQESTRSANNIPRTGNTSSIHTLDRYSNRGIFSEKENESIGKRKETGRSREMATGLPKSMEYRELQSGEQGNVQKTNTIQREGSRSYSSSSSKDLDKKVTEFLSSIGTDVQRLKDEGQDFNALADTVNNIIKVVDGKAQIDTLAHEATHLFLDLLPDDSKLLKDIIEDVVSRKEYDNIYDRYKDDKQYQNADGSVNEEKMAKEAAAHIIDDIIVDKFNDKKAIKWWQRLWKWITDKFKGRSIDAYSQVAEDVLDNNTTKLSKEKLRAMQEANNKGEIYYQLKPDQEEYIDRLKEEKSTTDIQKALIDAIYTKSDNPTIAEMGIIPHERVVLDEDTHIYTDAKGEVYHSVTKTTNGEFTPEQQEKYALNRDWGNDCDAILQGLVLGIIDPVSNQIRPRNINEIDTKVLPDKVKADVYSTLRAFLQEHTQKGEVPLTQVVVAAKGETPDQNRAGSIDLLLLSPDGTDNKVIDLKTSINPVKKSSGLSSTYTSMWQTKEGSVFYNAVFDKNNIIVLRPRDSKGDLVLEEGDKQVKLSKDLQHGIQVGAYSKMLEMQGIPVTGLYTLHLNLFTDKDSNVVNYKNEGLLSHPATDNQPYIDSVIPGKVDEDNPSQLQMNRPGYDYSDIDPHNPYNTDTRTPEQKEEDDEAINKLTSLVPVLDKAVSVIDQRVAWVRDLNSSKSGAEIKNSTIDTLTQFRRSLMKKLDSKDYRNALDSFMQFTRDQVKPVIDFLHNTDNITNSNGEDYPKIIEQARKFLDGYWGVYRLVSGEVGQRFLDYSKTVGMLNDLESSLSTGIRDYCMHYFTAMNPGGYTDESIADYVYKPVADIDLFTYGMEAPHNTKDIAVSMMDKTFRDAIFRANAESEKRITDLKQIFDTFLTATGKKKFEKGMFSFMVRPDGSYVTRVGQDYWSRVENARALIQDENGNNLDYKEGTSAEAIDYNKDLYGKKQVVTKLTQPEQYNFDKKDYDKGDYQQYTDEFLRARDKVMKQNAYGKYVPVDPNSRAYKEYQEKYMILIPDTYDISDSFDKNGNFTGVVGDKTNIWVVNPMYKEVRSISAHKEDLRDPAWKSMMDDTSGSGKAKMEFYNNIMSFLDLWKQTLPLGVYTSLKGKIPVKISTFMKRAIAAGPGILGVLGKAARDEFSYGAYSGERMVDEVGNFKESIPTGYSGSYKDQEKIDDLYKQIAALESRKTLGEFNDKKGIQFYREERKKLSKSLSEEQKRITPDQVEENFVKSLMEIIPQVHKYIALEAIEDKGLAIRSLVDTKTTAGEYTLQDSMGRDIITKGTGMALGKDESYVKKMVQDMVAHIMYGAGERDKSVVAKATELLMRFTGIKVFALNIFTSFSVGSMGSFNLIRAAVGGQHFGKKAFARAIGEYWSKMAPGYVKGKAISAGTGKVPKYSSKGEALIALYQVPVKMFVPDQGVFHLLTLNEHATEYFIQAMPAMAYMMDKDEVGKSGVTKKLYDAWNWDPETGEVHADPDFIHIQEEKKVLEEAGYMQDINNTEHGPFAGMEQNTMNRTILGKLVNMFHRVIWPNFKSRMGRRFVHQNFGEIEGSWVTTVNFFKDMRHYEGDIRKKMETGWNDLTDAQRSNMRKTLFDLITVTLGFAIIHIIKMAAEGVPEEDKNMKKWMNFIQKTSERVHNSQIMYVPVVGSYELYQVLKSPIASLGTMADFCDALQQTAQLPFPPYTDHYYTNGIHKGELKAAVKLKKVLPGVSVLGQWEGLTNGHYFHQ